MTSRIFAIVLLLVSGVDPIPTLDLRGVVTTPRKAEPRAGTVQVLGIVGDNAGEILQNKIKVRLKQTKAKVESAVALSIEVQNISPKPLVLPWTPHIDVVEGKPGTAYRFDQLELSIASLHDNRTEIVYQAVVYGASRLPESIVVLAPGEKVRFVAEVALPKIKTRSFRGALLLSRCSVYEKGGTLFQDVIQVLNARSEPMTPQMP
jgi:hypothetical protein